MEEADKAFLKNAMDDADAHDADAGDAFDADADDANYDGDDADADYAAYDEDYDAAYYAYDEDYDENNEDNYDENYDAAYDENIDDNYDAAYDAAYDENNVAAYDAAYDEDYDEDYDENNDDNYDEDYDAAYDEDYDENNDAAYDAAYDEDYDENYDAAYDEDYDENNDDNYDEDYDEDYDEKNNDAAYDENNDAAYDENKNKFNNHKRYRDSKKSKFTHELPEGFLVSERIRANSRGLCLLVLDKKQRELEPDKIFKINQLILKKVLQFLPEVQDKQLKEKIIIYEEKQCYWLIFLEFSKCLNKKICQFELQKLRILVKPVQGTNPHIIRSYFRNKQGNKENDLVSEKLKSEKFTLPKHLLTKNRQKQIEVQILQDWISKVNSQDYDIKPGLFIYSKQRLLGKTRLVNSLLSPENIAYSRGRISWQCLENVENKKMIFLDELTGKKMSPNDYQIIRTMVTGKSCNIVAPNGTSISLKSSPIMVIVTYDEDLLAKFCSDSRLYEVFYILEVKNYMGPPGTRNRVCKTLRSLTKNTRRLLENKKHH